ncbi:hypothetical protein BHM03_00012008 [Ensete ventricosum]|uniref:Uncharacterized protein n=1 Tax=Ensete ventricosum TaxID=4639 RepID=A0A445MDE4_ENSVE|nr:hypothetical protein BHM03_00012008 [Ensete ventricosum]
MRVCCFLLLVMGNRRSKEGMEVLGAYLCKKHDRLLAKLLQPNTYKKKSSLAIVDGFSVEISKEQVHFLGS